MLEKFRRELYSCVRCGICRDWGGWKEAGLICPWIKVTSGFETNYARGRMRLTQNFLEKDLPITNSFLEKVYLCSLCGSCEAHCPLELPTVNIFESLRSDLVEAGFQLERHKVLATRWLESGNPYGKPRTFNPHKPAKKADVLYFIGCTSAINANEIATATINVLERAGLNVSTLGENEPCCGSVFLRTGQRKLAKEAAAKTVRALESVKPNLVVTACAGCYRTIKQDYPLLGVKYDFEVQHSTQFLGELIRKGKLKLKRFDETITYHDPCHLGRHMKVYEEPREVLNSVPGINYVEIFPRKEHAVCCGAGGGARVAFPDKVNNIAVNRLEQVKNTGAQILTSACPFCYVNFKDAINKMTSKLKIYDVSQIIDQATR